MAALARRWSCARNSFSLPAAGRMRCVPGARGRARSAGDPQSRLCCSRVRRPRDCQTMLNVAPKSAAPSRAARRRLRPERQIHAIGALESDENRPDKVKLRSYQGTGVNPNAPFVGPQIEVYPGQTVRMTLHNELPADPTCPVERRQRQHSALLQRHQPAHPRPLDQSERQRRQRADLGQSRRELPVRVQHPAGSSGRHLLVSLAPARLDRAAGIQRHGRRPDRARHASADADRQWRPRHPAEADQRPALHRARDGVPADPVCLPRQGRQHRAQPRQTHLQMRCRTRSAASKTTISSAPGTWPQSGRFTSINGAVLGRLPGAEAGKVERWRMIHGGVRDSIALQFRKRAASAPEPAGLRAAAAQAYVDTNCTGAPVPYHLVAADGLTMAAATRTAGRGIPAGLSLGCADRVSRAGRLLHPRQCDDRRRQRQPEPPADATARHRSCRRRRRDRRSLRTISRRSLLAAAAANMPPDVRAKVTSEIVTGMKLTSFIPHPDVTITRSPARRRSPSTSTYRRSTRCSSRSTASPMTATGSTAP